MADRHDRSRAVWGQAGFSLAEVLIATAISGVVLLGLYLLYDINQVTFVKGEQQADLQQNARIAMDRIVRELRLAGSERQTTPVLPTCLLTAIQLAEATRINFIANVDPDDATERVEYTHDIASTPSQITREQWNFEGPGCADWSASGGAKSFAERVTTVAFTYYDGNNICLGGAAAPDCPAPPVPTINLGNIRRISITITTQDAQIGSTAQPFTLRAEVRPRNLGL